MWQWKRAGNVARKSLTVPDTANANLQNRINTSIIFNYLRDHGFAYRAQIARDLGISAPAVSRAIEKLRRDEYVIESERMPVDNGKRAAHISINAGHGYVLGIDLMTDPVEIAVSDFSGTILYTHLGKPVRSQPTSPRISWRPSAAAWPPSSARCRAGTCRFSLSGSACPRWSTRGRAPSCAQACTTGFPGQISRPMCRPIFPCRSTWRIFPTSPQSASGSAA